MLKPIRQKRHRLSPAAYYGEVTISITANVKFRKGLFLDSGIVRYFKDELEKQAARYEANVPIYCFMPDHLHLLIGGLTRTARPKQAIDGFKHETGIWLANNLPGFEWQHRYHDHILRSSEDWKTKARYIANNPVRAGLVEGLSAYPHTGSIGYDLADILYDSGK